jgi:sulfotransferase
MKSYYFISGLPRSGSTLLSAILRQNPEFYADIASASEHIIGSSIEAICESENNLTIDEEQRKNILHGIFDGYYKHIDKPIIFDSNRKWSKRTHLLKNLFPYTKLLCCVRDIVSILNSFELITSKNSFYRSAFSEHSGNVFDRCDGMMSKVGGIVSVPWICLSEGYAANPKMMMLIEYEDLCKEPEKTMRKVYEFLEKPYFIHDFDNVEYSNETYDKQINAKGLHTVKGEVEYNPPKIILPSEIVKKYSEMNMEFWRKSYKPYSDIIEKLIYQ